MQRMKGGWIIKKGIIILMSMVCCIVVTSTFYNKKFTVKSKSVKVIAHRGSSKQAPENSLSSIAYAAKDKADYTEFDVQQTKDGIVVLMHDRDLKRVAKISKNISDMNYDEVKKIDLGSVYSEKFKGEKIPTLEQVIKDSKGKIKLDIEIKCYGANKEGLVENVVKIIKKNNVTKSSLICSFDYDVLKMVKKLDSKIETGYITCFQNENILNLDYIDYYSVYYPRLNKELVSKIHKSNKKVHAWTVDNTNDMEKLIDMGVDNIITDYPDKLTALLK